MAKNTVGVITPSVQSTAIGYKYTFWCFIMNWKDF